VSLGAYSEVGRLRRVMVHRPGLEHARLTPSNAEELLFDDVIWVARAKAEHDMFVEVMRDRGRLGILIDQRVQEREGIAVPFFGRPALTSPILARRA